jgi:kynurenine formamidase
MDRASSERMRQILEQVKSWGRWGADDERGALNLMTPDRVVRASSLVTTGQVVSCAHDLSAEPSAENTSPALHMMTSAGDALDMCVLPGLEQTTDFLGVACHGMFISHIDALCHVFVGGVMYNGFTANEVKSVGAMRNSIGAAAQGIVGRGVLLDIPRLRGVAWLEPDRAIEPDELTAAERAQGVQVAAGDVLIVATGRDARRASTGTLQPFVDGLAGLHPECIPWLRERDIAVLASDGISDPLPPNDAPDWPVPVHQCCIAAMGVHLLDNLALGELLEVCARIGRWEFLFTCEPLRAPRATGSPVNPVAIL